MESSTVDDGVPTVTGYRTPDGKKLCFYCPYCRERHYHEVPPLAAEEIIHRSAHCRPEISPGQVIKGYFIREKAVRKLAPQ
jgi:hypothetical protein